MEKPYIKIDEAKIELAEDNDGNEDPLTTENIIGTASNTDVLMGTPSIRQVCSWISDGTNGSMFVDEISIEEIKIEPSDDFVKSWPPPSEKKSKIVPDKVVESGQSLSSISGTASQNEQQTRSTQRPRCKFCSIPFFKEKTLAKHQKKCQQLFEQMYSASNSEDVPKGMQHTNDEVGNSSRPDDVTSNLQSHHVKPACTAPVVKVMSIAKLEAHSSSSISIPDSDPLAGDLASIPSPSVLLSIAAPVLCNSPMSLSDPLKASLPAVVDTTLFPSLSISNIISCEPPPLAPICTPVCSPVFVQLRPSVSSTPRSDYAQKSDITVQMKMIANDVIKTNSRMQESLGESTGRPVLMDHSVLNDFGFEPDVIDKAEESSQSEPSFSATATYNEEQYARLRCKYCSLLFFSDNSLTKHQQKCQQVDEQLNPAPKIPFDENKEGCSSIANLEADALPSIFKANSDPLACDLASLAPPPLVSLNMTSPGLGYAQPMPISDPLNIAPVPPEATSSPIDCIPPPLAPLSIGSSAYNSRFASRAVNQTRQLKNAVQHTTPLEITVQLEQIQNEVTRLKSENSRLQPILLARRDLYDFNFELLETRNQLEELEEKLGRDAAFAKKMVSWLNIKSGTSSPKTGIARSLDLLFSGQLFASCSWSGEGWRGPKIPFCKLKNILKLLRRVASVKGCKKPVEMTRAILRERLLQANKRLNRKPGWKTYCRKTNRIESSNNDGPTGEIASSTGSSNNDGPTGEIASSTDSHFRVMVTKDSPANQCKTNTSASVDITMVKPSMEQVCSLTNDGATGDMCVDVLQMEEIMMKASNHSDPIWQLSSEKIPRDAFDKAEESRQSVTSISGTASHNANRYQRPRCNYCSLLFYSEKTLTSHQEKCQQVFEEVLPASKMPMAESKEGCTGSRLDDVNPDLQTQDFKGTCTSPLAKVKANLEAEAVPSISNADLDPLACDSPPLVPLAISSPGLSNLLPISFPDTLKSHHPAVVNIAAVPPASMSTPIDVIPPPLAPFSIGSPASVSRLTSRAEYQSKQQNNATVVQHSIPLEITVQLEQLKDVVTKLRSENCQLHELLGVSTDQPILVDRSDSDEFDFEPLDTRNQLEEFEENLGKDAAFADKMVSWLSSEIGDCSTKKTVARSLDLLFSRQLFASCSWSGVGRNSPKIPFYKLKNIHKLMLRVVGDKGCNEPAEKTIALMQKKLRHAKRLKINTEQEEHNTYCRKKSRIGSPNNDATHFRVADGNDSTKDSPACQSNAATSASADISIVAASMTNETWGLSTDRRTLLDCSILKDFDFEPLETLNQLEEFEKNLGSDVAFADKMCCWLSSETGVCSPKKGIARSLDLLFSRQLFARCSWAGKGWQGPKIPFCKFENIHELLRRLASVKGCKEPTDTTGAMLQNMLKQAFENGTKMNRGRFRKKSRFGSSNNDGPTASHSGVAGVNDGTKDSSAIKCNHDNSGNADISSVTPLMTHDLLGVSKDRPILLDRSVSNDFDFEPLNSYDQLKKFDENLASDAAFADKMVRWLCSKNGNCSPKTSVGGALDLLFSNQLFASCSWSGATKQGPNIPFYKFENVHKLLQQLAIAKGCSEPSGMTRDVVQKRLHYAKQKLKRKTFCVNDSRIGSPNNDALAHFGVAGVNDGTKKSPANQNNSGTIASADISMDKPSMEQDCSLTNDGATGDMCVDEIDMEEFKMKPSNDSDPIGQLSSEKITRDAIDKAEERIQSVTSISGTASHNEQQSRRLRCNYCSLLFYSDKSLANHQKKCQQVDEQLNPASKMYFTENEERGTKSRPDDVSSGLPPFKGTCTSPDVLPIIFKADSDPLGCDLPPLVPLTVFSQGRSNSLPTSISDALKPEHSTFADTAPFHRLSTTPGDPITPPLAPYSIGSPVPIHSSLRVDNQWQQNNATVPQQTITSDITVQLERIKNEVAMLKKQNYRLRDSLGVSTDGVSKCVDFEPLDTRNQLDEFEENLGSDATFADKLVAWLKSETLQCDPKTIIVRSIDCLFTRQLFASCTWRGFGWRRPKIAFCQYKNIHKLLQQVASSLRYEAPAALVEDTLRSRLRNGPGRVNSKHNRKAHCIPSRGKKIRCEKE